MTESPNRPVLVTGGCGFIGCNIADRLASRGRTVVVLDNLARTGVACWSLFFEKRSSKNSSTASERRASRSATR